MKPTLHTLGQRAHGQIPSIYRLIGLLGLAYFAAFLLLQMVNAAPQAGLGRVFVDIKALDATGLVLWPMLGLLLGAVIYSKLSNWIFALLGLLLFIGTWPGELIHWGWRAWTWLPLAFFFLWRAVGTSAWLSIGVACASITLFLLASVDPRILFPGMSPSVIKWMAWGWALFVGMCVINLVVAALFGNKATKTKALATAGSQEPSPSAPEISLAERHERAAALRKKYEPVYAYPARRARHSLDDVIGMDAVKAQLREAGGEALKANSTTNGILMYGHPGNGKTYLAEALAGTLEIDFIDFDYGAAVSKWVGETTQNAMKVFDEAQQQAPCVLLIDEAEALLSDRAEETQGEGKKTSAALLKKLVSIRQAGVVVIAATNHLDQIDGAAVREGRFDTKIEITNPDARAREHLIAKAFAYASGSAVALERDVLDSLVTHWDGFSVSRVTAVAAKVGRKVQVGGLALPVAVERFQEALREVQGSHGDIVPSSEKGLDALHYDGAVGQQLADLAESMRRSFEFEQLGGRVITGAMFFGPPGTGKTIAAKALAKSSGWALIVTNGTELARSPDKIRLVIQRAINLKPAIVLIDEADALISDRSTNWNAAATNAFLSETGDGRASLRDVLFIAATNNPDSADSAMVRGGRFGEHIEFTLPQEETIRAYLRSEADKSRSHLPEAVLLQVSAQMVGLPLSDVGEAFIKACNRCASRALKAGEVASKDQKQEIKLTDFSVARAERYI